MLAGLAGVMLPLIAHLLSRKKYDLVDWGAMQFLELDPSAKRKVRLEELLLMLVRMAIVAVIAIALARPWLSGRWLLGLVSNQSRDVVLVIDGSYSTGWEGKDVTPHLQSIKLARQFLNELRPGDTITVKGRPSSHTLVKLMMTDHPQPIPDFLEVIPGENPEGRMTRMPSRGDVDPRISDIREQLIIEIATR